MSDRLTAYLDRIQYSGTPRPDADTLRQIHRQHLLTIPYENLYIHEGRALVLDTAWIYDKIVIQGRGGWCFEMNGLLAWALSEIGFSVTMLSGTVNRAANGDIAEGNHLVLKVMANQRPWLADVGFGTGFLEPLPLEVGVYPQGFGLYELVNQEGRWLFQQPNGGSGYDFTETPRSFEHFAGQCHRLQTSPESAFVASTVCHKHMPEGVVSLRGLVLRTQTAFGIHERVIKTQADYEHILRDTFGLSLENTTVLWHLVEAQHLKWIRTLD